MCAFASTDFIGELAQWRLSWRNINTRNYIRDITWRGGCGRSIVRQKKKRKETLLLFENILAWKEEVNKSFSGSKGGSL